MTSRKNEYLGQSAFAPAERAAACLGALKNLASFNQSALGFGWARGLGGLPAF
jgi:hypothetical protein